MTLSKRVKAAIEVMIAEGADRPTAALRVGLADNSLRQAFANPQVLRFWNAELAALRDSEGVRTLRTLVEVRDDPALKVSAAGQKVRIDAGKALEKLGREGGCVQIVNNVQINNEAGQQPGYIVAVDPRFDRPMTAAESRRISGVSTFEGDGY